MKKKGIPPPAAAPPPGPRLTALAPAELASLLDKSGAPGATEADVAAAIAAGAPTNTDGTLNFMHLAAWLASHATSQP